MSLTMATYIDNLYSVSNEAEGAVSIMNDAERYLQAKWQLTLKPSSKQVTSAAVGAEHVTGDKIDGYEVHEDFPVLGHLVNNAGSMASAFEATVQKMWKAFWGNAGSKGARTLGRQRKASLVGRAVRPLFEFVCARWPAQITYLKAIDVIQRKMISSSFGLWRMSGESQRQYNSRCGRIAEPYIDQPWSHVRCKRMETWEDHVARHAELWPARICAFHDAHRLEQRRLASGSQSVFAGSTQTRASRAKVERRWHDGLAFGREFMSSN